MVWRNSLHGFGLVTRSLHWLTAAGVIGMIGLGLFLGRSEPRLSTIWLYGLHKSIGLGLLVLTLIRLVWHRVSPPPRPLAGLPHWHMRLAIWVHRGLYLCLIAMPLLGWIGSAATGLDVVVFNLFALPRIAPVSEVWSVTFLGLHAVTGALFASLIALHITGALWRHWGHGDGTLRRMVRGTPMPRTPPKGPPPA